MKKREILQRAIKYIGTLQDILRVMEHTPTENHDCHSSGADADVTPIFPVYDLTLEDTPVLSNVSMTQSEDMIDMSEDELRTLLADYLASLPNDSDQECYSREPESLPHSSRRPTDSLA